MQIATNTVVTLDYTLKDDEGTVLDTSRGAKPFVYLHGAGAVIPGLEKALEGKTAGTKLEIRIPPEDAYGAHDKDLIDIVARDRFDAALDLTVGMQFENTNGHQRRIVTIIGIDGDQITLDANHPLAGATLHFDVMVNAVRAATQEELQHGHPHDPNSPHHH